MKLCSIFLFVFFPLVSFSQSRTTEEVYNHHEEAFLTQDISALMKDYDEASILITPDGKIQKGTEAIRKTFEYAFSEALPAESNLKIIHKVIGENIVYLVYSASDRATGKEYWEFAADTFIIENGKIKYQTIAAKQPDIESRD